jgi:hypothetical protein|tara:strand:- start:1417 stop:2895 length:1479 start_codon:yes stop_codon:yes gene_type:complete
LLQVRRVSVEYTLQDELRAENAAAGDDAIYTARTAGAVSDAMRQVPYSAAIGPPRRTLADVVLEPMEGIPQGALVPNGTLLFTMHPGMVAGEKFRADGDPPPLRADPESWTQAEIGDHDRIFGVGPRSCLSEAFALNFLNAVFAVALKNFRLLGPPNDLSRQQMFQYKEDGAHLAPLNNNVHLFAERILSEAAATTISTEEAAMRKADDMCERRRRRLQLKAPRSELRPWIDEWTDRVGCWWLSLPPSTRTNIGACMGALGVHLAERLDEALRAARRIAGRSSVAARAVAGGDKGHAGEHSCEWVSEEHGVEHLHKARIQASDMPRGGSAGAPTGGDDDPTIRSSGVLEIEGSEFVEIKLPTLPEFPPLELLPEGFTLPALPRLLPRILPLQSRNPSRDAHAQHLDQDGDEIAAHRAALDQEGAFHTVEPQRREREHLDPLADPLRVAGASFGAGIGAAILVLSAGLVFWRAKRAGRLALRERAAHLMNTSR